MNLAEFYSEQGRVDSPEDVIAIEDAETRERTAKLYAPLQVV